MQSSGPSHPGGSIGDYARVSEEHRRMMLATRSFTTQAVIALVLYFVLWLPGLIANIVWYLEARNIEQQTGRAPDGKGCLSALLWVFIVVAGSS
jgi:hypothetical protein